MCDVLLLYIVHRLFLSLFTILKFLSFYVLPFMVNKDVVSM